MAAPPLERGTITTDGGLIIAVEPRGARSPDVDLGEVAIVPGLINAHTHLDLGGARGRIPSTDPEHFTDWLLGVIEYRRTRAPEQVREDIRSGLVECLTAGTTAVGDISSDGNSFPLLAESEVRAVIFREFLGLDREVVENRIVSHRQRLESLPGQDRLHWGISPHAPYSICHDVALHQLRLAGGAIHLAESPAELELLSTGKGPFTTFLRDLGVWADGSITRPLAEFVTGVTDHSRRSRQLYIHCNYLPVTTPFENTQSVVYCPRTHAAFGHSRHPFAEFLARGVNVALGTDSLASNPDLDLFEEARFVYQNRKDMTGEQILKMATLNGAKALGFDDDCGSLEPGKSADFVVMPLGDAAGPYMALFNSSGARRTLFKGSWRN